MVHSFRVSLAASTLTLFLLHAPWANAQPRGGASPNAPDALTQEFETGQKLFLGRNFSEAVTVFRKVYAASHSPNAHLYLARSLRELGKFAEAYDEMAATVREATIRLEKETKYAPTRDAAAAELALLEPRVGKLVVALPENAADGAEVTVAGQPLARDRIGTPVAVMPGTVVVTAGQPGKEPLRREVSVRGGESKTVTLNLQETKSEADAATPKTPEPPPVSPEASNSHGLRLAGYVVAGVGVVGFAVFGVGHVISQGKFDTLRNECGGQRCTDPKYGQVVDDGKQWQTISTAGLVVGAAGVAIGATLIAVDLLGAKKETSTARTSPSRHMNLAFSPSRVVWEGTW